ncbi:MAG TPA: hypothetical protein VFL93_00135 [Longimicrobiaceae bacterium]|nr:hypothetical protein [Longimicrobiaceae bacterium]
MAERNDEVAARVQAILSRDRDASTTDLMRAASEVDPTVDSLSKRQFNASYVLPAKRLLGHTAKRGAGKKSPRAKAPAGHRRSDAARVRGGGSERHEQVRAVLLEFARDFSAAESRSQIVDVLSHVDRYVEKIVRAKG